jgi:MoxR-like ATPase
MTTTPDRLNRSDSTDWSMHATGSVVRLQTADQAASAIGLIQSSIGKSIRGKSDQIRLAVACMLAEGHLLIEDNPGTGKTSLAKALAATIGGMVRRVQFTPDLLPSDITGVSIFNPQLGEFVYREGPAFTNILIADEINRASPKTQAALLEVMEERHITVDGQSRPVPSPFMVVATQNPLDFHGTFPLPEVQLDRFAMRITLGYADRASEAAVMVRQSTGHQDEPAPTVFSIDQMQWLVRAARSVTVGAPLREYVADIVQATRSHPDLRLGVSTRGMLTLLAVARALALGEGRLFVTPDDIKMLADPVLAHRLVADSVAEIDGVTTRDVLAHILDTVAVPRTTDSGATA